MAPETVLHSIEPVNSQTLRGRTVVVLLPTFNDWESVFSLLPLIDSQLAPMGADVHVVIVDDGSTTTRSENLTAALSFNFIKQIDEIALTRNQGNQRAIAIGIGFIADKLNADFLIVMDSDHEDNPVYIPQLINKSLSNSDGLIVFAERTRRSEGPLFKFFYWCYQRIFRLFTGASISMGNYCAMPWSAVRRVSHLSELWTHFPAAIMRSRLRYSAIPAERGTRLHGKSSMRIASLIAHAFGGFWLHADVFAARTLLTAAISSALILLCASGLLISNYLTQVPPITRWTLLGLSLLIILLVQVVSIAVNIMFLAAIARAQSPMIPVRVYERFILVTETLKIIKTD